jgi:nucleotide-binding universal stress UspA family protein
VNVAVGRPEAPPREAARRPRVRPVMLLTFDVPFDGTAVSFALDTAAETGAELYVCDGIPVAPNPIVGTPRTFGSSEARAATDEVAREARSRGVRAKQLLFHHPRPVHAALEVTREEGVGLLVFGSDRGRMGRWRFRRIARRLRKSCSCLIWAPH